MEYSAGTPRLQDEVLLAGKPRRIGLLGGTFNPLHNGHLLIAQQAQREFDLDKVLFLVAGDPPHKHGPEVLAKELRYEMVDKVLSSYPQFAADGVELHRSGPSYTVDTINELRRQHPEAQFSFIIGEDTLYQLEGWRNFPELAKLTEFICLRRPLSPQLVNPDLQAKILRDRYGAVIHLSDYRGPDISSTDIRQRLAKGESIRGLVPKSVEEQIYGAGLYQQPGSGCQPS